MQEELKRYSAKVVADGSSPIQGRVGINTGEVVVRSIQTGAGQVGARTDRRGDLGTIEEALQANPEELVFRPNALTCRGELRLKLDQIELAEADFHEAITLAQNMSAKTFELRGD
jgi:hypothetical protein